MHPNNVDDIIELVRTALEAGKLDDAILALRSLHPADRADAFMARDDSDQQTLLTGLDTQDRADLLEEMPGEDAAELASEFTPHELAEVLDEMYPEDAADILGDLPKAQAASTLAQMEEAPEVTPLLGYRVDSAGGIMSPEFFALSESETADEVIQRLRREQLGAETPYYLYVVSNLGELVGIVPLRELITADPHTTVRSIMRSDIVSVSVDTDQEELAQVMKRYRLLLMPVVDDNQRLVGVVKNEDLVDVIEEEATEDMYRLGGLADGQLQVWSPFRKSVARRLPWLYVNLVTAFLAAWVVSLFRSTLEELALLAIFQGIIAGQGGNAGTQTLTLIVRGLALGEVEFSDSARVLGREILIGLLHGAAVGAAVGIGAYWWMGMPWLGVIAAIAMVGTMLAAACAGTLFPLLLRFVKLDPALASGVLVTTITDCVGFGLFLYLATVFLPWLKP